MGKFCPNCGKQININAKFCMECGAKLADYTNSNSGSTLSDNVIQRSNVGAASIGNIHIHTSNPEPTRKLGWNERICPKCGKIATITSGSYHPEMMVGSIKYIYELNIRAGLICPHCTYKVIYSESDVVYSPCSIIICVNCGGFIDKGRCIQCGKMYDSNWYARSDWIQKVPVKQALKNAGWDTSFI